MGSAVVALQREPWSRVRPAVVGPALLALWALGLWLASLQDVDIRALTDLGIASVLPAQAFAALALLTVSFFLALHRERPSVPVLLLHVVALIVMLYGVSIMIGEAARASGSWRHVGVADYINRHGGVNPYLDHRHNWPGFFVLVAFATQLTGLPSLIGLAAWSDLYSNLLYLGPLAMIYRAATSNQRVVWLAVWFFFLTNWVGQDYFSPQALGYFLHLTLFAVLLTWFRPPAGAPLWSGPLPARLAPAARLADRVVGWFRPAAAPLTLTRPLQRAGLIAVVALIMLVGVSIHQLTPFVTLTTLVLLVAFNRIVPRGLVVLLAVLISAWMVYFAAIWLSGQFATMVKDAGSVKDVVDANLTGRMKGSPEHLIVVYGRLALASAVWLLGLLGALRCLKNGYRDATCAILAVTPFIFAISQPYGGEILQRTFFFTLPGTVFFVASLLFPRPDDEPSWLRTACGIVLSLGLVGGFLIARHGNERMDWFSHQEIAALEFAYDVAKPEQMPTGNAERPKPELLPRLVTGSWNIPWQHRNEEMYEYVYLDESNAPNPPPNRLAEIDADHVANVLRAKAHIGSYLIISRSQKAESDLISGVPAGTLDRLEQEILASGKFAVIYENQDARVFTLSPAGLQSTGTGVKP
jgi:hypothetical protein